MHNKGSLTSMNAEGCSQPCVYVLWWVVDGLACGIHSHDLKEVVTSSNSINFPAR
eukprot:c40105_g1_i1 orf=280-444(-)